MIYEEHAAFSLSQCIEIRGISMQFHSVPFSSMFSDPSSSQMCRTACISHPFVTDCLFCFTPEISEVQSHFERMSKLFPGSTAGMPTSKNPDVWMKQKRGSNSVAWSNSEKKTLTQNNHVSQMFLPFQKKKSPHPKTRTPNTTSRHLLFVQTFLPTLQT